MPPAPGQTPLVAGPPGKPPCAAGATSSPGAADPDLSWLSSWPGPLQPVPCQRATRNGCPPTPGAVTEVPGLSLHQLCGRCAPDLPGWIPGPDGPAPLHSEEGRALHWLHNPRMPDPPDGRASPREPNDYRKTRPGAHTCLSRHCICYHTHGPLPSLLADPHICEASPKEEDMGKRAACYAVSPPSCRPKAAPASAMRSRRLAAKHL